jgi:hypothetical protein
MISPKYDGSFDLTFVDQIVNCEPESGSLSIPQPTYSRWQAEKRNLLSSQTNPSTQRLVFWEEFQR